MKQDEIQARLTFIRERQNMRKPIVDICRLVLMRIRTDDDQWRSTDKGEHFLLGEGGEIKAGFGGKFTGKKPGEAFGKEDKNNQGKHKTKTENKRENPTTSTIDTTQHLERDVLINRMSENELKAFSDYAMGSYEDRLTDTVVLTDFIDNNPDLQWTGGELYRGVSLSSEEYSALMKTIGSGGSIDQRGASSWSTDEQIASDYSHIANDRTKRQERVVFIDKTVGQRNAMSIQNISGHGEEEKEVLYSGNSKHKVLMVLSTNDYYGEVTHIYLQESK